MKILHLSYSDRGGAAKAALRLCIAQRESGLDSSLLVFRKTTSYPFVESYATSKTKITNLVKIITSKFILDFFNVNKGYYSSLNVFPSGLYRKLNAYDIDILHIHWINNEMISIKEICKIKKKIVWTLHDSWAFCGAEHYPRDLNDESFVNGYKEKGINQYLLKKKCKYFGKINSLIITTPSNWETTCAQKSLVFKGRSIFTIFNVLDIKIFDIVNKKFAFEILKLNPNKKYILVNGVMDQRKGGDILIKTLKCFSSEQKKGLHILVFGADYEDRLSSIDIPVTFFGQIQSEYMMALLYNAAHVTAVPSKMESFGQVASESIACGTPVVAFDCTGLKDVIKHYETGYLAQPYDWTDFFFGLVAMIENSSQYSSRCREYVIQNFSKNVIVPQFNELYFELLNRHETMH